MLFSHQLYETLLETTSVPHGEQLCQVLDHR